MKTLYISIVSHNQEEMIIENFSNFLREAGDYKVILCFIDNTGAKCLEEFANENENLYFYDGVRRGFGANHNKAFELCTPANDDIFIVCNPDIIIEPDQLRDMVMSFTKNNADMGNVKCYYNKEKTILSPVDRYFPCFLNFVFSIALGKRYHYGSNEENPSPEWISGEFILFRPNAYRLLGGFDEGYFMYVEDVDLSYRARKLGLTIAHDPKHYVIHETQMASRKIVSKSFVMHFKSVFRFLWQHKRFCVLKIAD